MSIYEAIIVVNAMVKANKENVDFSRSPVLDNLIGDCLKLCHISGGYDKVMEHWEGWSQNQSEPLSAQHVRECWRMAHALLSECSVEID